jgi:hypothetical protein
MTKKIHFYLLQGVGRYGGVVVARFARRNTLWQKRLTVKAIRSERYSHTLTLQSCGTKRLLDEIGVSGLKSTQATVWCCALVSGGLLVFAASNASADKPNIKLFSRLR